MGSEIIDMHIHFGAPNDPASGCYWSHAFEEGLAYYAFRLVAGLPFGALDIERVKKRLLQIIDGAAVVKKSVILALDEVYDLGGHVQKDRTHLYVPNECVAQMAQEDPRVLFGASVHPYRADWESKLDFCLSHGAVFCKWIPSSQQIDPSDPLCDRFYKKLADNGLPLLCHGGPEGSIPPFDDVSESLNDPRLLKRALASGVTVIVPHCALPLLPPPLGSEATFLDLLALFQEADTRGWKLYADLSALCLGTRNSYIDRVKAGIPCQKLLFGSDFPILLMDFSQEPHLSPEDWLKHFFQTLFIENPLDKAYYLIKNMEFDDSVFTNASRVLKMPV